MESVYECRDSRERNGYRAGFYMTFQIVMASAVVLMIQVKGVMNAKVKELELSKPETVRVKENYTRNRGEFSA